MIYGTQEFTDLVYDMIVNNKRHDLYKKTVECAEKMRIHVYGDKPVELLKRVRPGEPDEIQKYRAENYEPTTKSTAAKALSIVSKIFNPSLSTITWKDQSESGKRLQKFALEDFPKTNSVIKFLSEAGMKRMIADPNGVFAVKPSQLPESDLKYAIPEVKVYGSPNIWWYDKDCFVIHIKTEDGKNGKIEYFEYYDKNWVRSFTGQVINSKVTNVITLEEYENNFPSVPVWFLTGETETSDNGEEYYISFFEPALPFWNKAIMHESDLDADFIMHQYPQKVMLSEECDFIHDDIRCSQGWIKYPDGGTAKCPSCKGTGKSIPVGPYGFHLVDRSKLEAGMSGMDPVKYLNVPTDSTKLLKERVDEMHKKGLSALNMDIVDSVGENQSGIAKVIDRGELYDFLYKISDVCFDTHLQNFFYFFNLYINGVRDSNPGRNLDNNLPNIVKPTSFDLTSVAEKTALYAEAKKATMPAEYLRQKAIETADKDFGSAPDIQRTVITAIELDPLPEMSPEAVELNLANGLVSQKDAVIHTNISNFIERAYQLDKSFYEKTKQEKTEIIGKIADEFVKENKAKLTVKDDSEGSGGQNRDDLT